MHKNEDAEKLLIKLTRVAYDVRNEGAEPREERNLKLLSQIDIKPYVEAAAWPGRSYLLIGNSCNLERHL
ncbi:MAG TPA: hypothetical protein V6D17_21205, partial [Candidatus Obscuribacterales bacterium]